MHPVQPDESATQYAFRYMRMFERNWKLLYQGFVFQERIIPNKGWGGEQENKLVVRRNTNIEGCPGDMLSQESFDF